MLLAHDWSKSFAQEVKARRERLGLTHEEVARRANLTQGYVRQVESCRRSPSLEAAGLLCLALGAYEVVFNFRND